MKETLFEILVKLGVGISKINECGSFIGQNWELTLFAKQYN